MALEINETEMERRRLALDQAIVKGKVLTSVAAVFAVLLWFIALREPGIMPKFQASLVSLAVVLFGWLTRAATRKKSAWNRDRQGHHRL